MIDRRTFRLLAALSISLLVAVNSANAGLKVNYVPSHREISSFTSGKRDSIGGFNMRLTGENTDGSYSSVFHRQRRSGTPQEESDDGSPRPFIQSYTLTEIDRTECPLPIAACELPKINLPCSVGPVHFFIPVSPLELIEKETQLVKFANSIWRDRGRTKPVARTGH
jgi:hypothetical protein